MIDDITQRVNEELGEVKTKLKLKTDLSDTLKLEEMLLNLINFTYENVVKRFANKV